MNEISDVIARHGAEILVVTLLLVLASIGGLATVARRQRRDRDRWRELLDGTRGARLETLLEEHLREREETQRRLEEVLARLEALEERFATTKRHLGLVRFDAFEEVAGNQSFALALYDDRGDGAILSAVVGRNDARVYCKPLLKGQSERNLSNEERRAIEAARDVGPKSLVSP
jgi:hypothetical protein